MFCPSLLLAVPLLAMLQPPPDPAPLSLTGPATCPAGAGPVALLLTAPVPLPCPPHQMHLAIHPADGARLSPLLTWEQLPFLLFLPGQPGNYTVSVCLALGDHLEHAQHTITVTAQPDPAPDPNPKPNPAPDPPATGRWFILVYESLTDGPRLAPLLNSRQLVERLKQRGDAWLPFDRDICGRNCKPPRDLAPYVDLAAGRHPFLIVVAATGDILYSGACPATPDALLQLLP